MFPDRPLLDRLRDYLSRHAGLNDESLQPSASWPTRLAGWSGSFPLFEWLQGEAPQGPRLFGIRRLVDQAPFRLSDLRARGFRTESSRRPTRPPIRGSVEHYLIADLAAPQAAVVYLCMYSPSGEWYVLDEHRIVRA